MGKSYKKTPISKFMYHNGKKLENRKFRRKNKQQKNMDTIQNHNYFKVVSDTYNIRDFNKSYISKENYQKSFLENQLLCSLNKNHYASFLYDDENNWKRFYYRK